jgi:hypothetical protein
MSYTERNKILSVRVSTELIDELDRKARANNCSRSDYVLGVLGKDTGVEIEPPKVFGEDRILALENKLAEVEKKILSNKQLGEIMKQVIMAMKQVGQL